MTRYLLSDTGRRRHSAGRDILLVGLAAFALTACPVESVAPPAQTAPTVATIVLTPASNVSLTAPGATVQVHASPRSASGEALSATVSWASSNPSVATVNDGTITAVSSGTATITASAGNVSASVAVTVTLPPASIGVSPGSASLVSLGETRQLTATARDAGNATVTGVTFSWVSSAPAIATVNASTGLVTAVGNGTATITASGAGLTGSATITVAQAVSTVTVTPTTVTIAGSGSTQQLAAAPRDANGNAVAGATVAWTTSAASVATVNASGLVTAVAAGSATITATAGGASGVAAVTVTQPPASITVTPTPVFFGALGSMRTLTAIARDAGNAPISGVTFAWTSSAPGVATVNASSGVVTSVASGSATITASAGGISGTTTVSVSQFVTSVAVSPTPVTLASINATQQLVAVARDSNNNTVAGATFTWTTSSATVATVSTAGLATAQANGTATITATSGSRSGTAAVTVAQALSSIAVSPTAALLLTTGATQQFTAVGSDAGGTAMSPATTVTWSSSATGVATISSAGLATAVANGSATITATGGGRTGTATLTVQLNPCLAKDTLSLTSPWAANTVGATDCNVQPLYSGSSTMERGHLHGFTLSSTSRLELLMTATTFSPVLQLRSATASTLIQSVDAGTGSFAKLVPPSTTAAGMYSLLTGAKAGQSGAYDVYVGAMAPDQGGTPCPSIGVLTVSTTFATVDGEIGDGVGCGSGASQRDVYLLANPFAAGRLELWVEGRGAFATDRSFGPTGFVFSADGINLGSLPLSDPHNVFFSLCVDPANPGGGWYQSVIGSCNPNDTFGYRTINKGRGLYFVRIQAAKAGTYRIRYRWR